MCTLWNRKFPPTGKGFAMTEFKNGKVIEPLCWPSITGDALQIAANRNAAATTVSVPPIQNDPWPPSFKSQVNKPTDGAAGHIHTAWQPSPAVKKVQTQEQTQLRERIRQINLANLAATTAARKHEERGVTPSRATAKVNQKKADQGVTELTRNFTVVMRKVDTNADKLNKFEQDGASVSSQEVIAHQKMCLAGVEELGRR